MIRFSSGQTDPLKQALGGTRSTLTVVGNDPWDRRQAQRPGHPGPTRIESLRRPRGPSTSQEAESVRRVVFPGRRMVSGWGRRPDRPVTSVPGRPGKGAARLSRRATAAAGEDVPAIAAAGSAG